MDETLGVALVWGKNPKVRVERRNPTEEELRDQKVLKLDVGGVSDPGTSNLDHHNIPVYKGRAVCAYTLLADWLGVAHLFSRFGWYEAGALLDNTGPMAAAKTWECKPEVIFNLQNPIFGWILQEFSKQTVLDPAQNSLLYQILSNAGKHLWQQAEELEGKLSVFDQHVELIEVKGVKGLLNKTPLELNPIHGFEIWKRERGHTQVAFSISFDDRGTGLTLYRFDDSPLVDFSRLNKKEGITFAHQNGFIAKMVGLDYEKALEFVAQSLV